jgi:hypothetical protein
LTPANAKKRCMEGKNGTICNSRSLPRLRWIYFPDSKCEP